MRVDRAVDAEPFRTVEHGHETEVGHAWDRSASRVEACIARGVPLDKQLNGLESFDDGCLGEVHAGRRFARGIADQFHRLDLTEQPEVVQWLDTAIDDLCNLQYSYGIRHTVCIMYSMYENTCRFATGYAA